VDGRMSKKYEIIIVGGERMLISYSTFEQRLHEIKLRFGAHRAIVESKRECALIKAALNI
jgi:hypothetical protein